MALTQDHSEADSTQLLYCQQSLVVPLQEQVGAALGLVKQILERRPDHYVALAQLMSLLRRAGRIAEGEKHLQTSLQKVVRGASSAGEQARCLRFSLGYGLAAWEALFAGKTPDCLEFC